MAVKQEQELQCPGDRQSASHLKAAISSEVFLCVCVAGVS